MEEKAEAIRFVGWLCVTLAVVVLCFAATVASVLGPQQGVLTGLVLAGMALLVGGAWALLSRRGLTSGTK